MRDDDFRFVEWVWDRHLKHRERNVIILTRYPNIGRHMLQVMSSNQRPTKRLRDMLEYENVHVIQAHPSSFIRISLGFRGHVAMHESFYCYMDEHAKSHMARQCKEALHHIALRNESDRNG